MRQTSQQYEHAQFMNEISHQYQDTSLQQQGHVTFAEQNPAKGSSFVRNQSINRQPPHYWPADKVPYVGISYCDCIQYVFAFLFICILIWIFVGLKHFGEQKQALKGVKAQQQQNSENQETIQLDIDQKKFQEMVRKRNKFQAENGGSIDEDLFGQQSGGFIVNRAFDNEPFGGMQNINGMIQNDQNIRAKIQFSREQV